MVARLNIFHNIKTSHTHTHMHLYKINISFVMHELDFLPELHLPSFLAGVT